MFLQHLMTACIKYNQATVKIVKIDTFPTEISCMCLSIYIPTVSIPSFLPLPFLTCCDSIDLIWWEGTHFSRRLVAQPLSDGLLAEVFRGFPHPWGKCQEMCALPPASPHYYSYNKPTDAPDMIFGVSGHWLWIRWHRHINIKRF